MARSSSFFRAATAAVIIDNNGRVLAFERSDIPGAWQFPQGGLNQGEPPIEGVLREIFEETGIAEQRLELLSEHPDWIAYELPDHVPAKKKFRGQVQKWFLFRFKGRDKDIDLSRATDDEFCNWRWMNMSEVIDLTIPFRRRTYHKIAEGFSQWLAK
jgi:putative (di)nucleoside polyphosphate hydrolase